MCAPRPLPRLSATLSWPCDSNPLPFVNCAVRNDDVCCGLFDLAVWLGVNWEGGCSFLRHLWGIAFVRA